MSKKAIKCNADTATGQIGYAISTPWDALGCSVETFRKVDGLLQSLEYRVAFWDYDLNRSEMWALISLNAYLETLDRNICSLNKFLEYLSGNYRHRAKFMGFMRGLLEKKCLGSFEYVHKPGSFSVGISDFGFQMIDLYYQQMAGIFGRYVPADISKYKGRSISFPENIPSYYRQSA